MFGHCPTDVYEIVGDHTEPDQHFIPLSPLYRKRLSPCPLLVTLTSGRNQRFFCSRLRLGLLVERLGAQMRLTPLDLAAASFLAQIECGVCRLPSPAGKFVHRFQRCSDETPYETRSFHREAHQTSTNTTRRQFLRAASSLGAPVWPSLPFTLVVQLPRTSDISALTYVSSSSQSRLLAYLLPF